jgi:Iron-containing redox enzyme
VCRARFGGWGTGYLAAMTRQSLPAPRGPVTQSLLRRLRTGSGMVHTTIADEVLADEDVQLAMHVIYELSYRGYAEVDDAMECDPAVVDLCRRIERTMEAELRAAIPAPPADAEALLRDIASRSDGPSLSGSMAAHPDLEQFREFAIHRSAYQLKEADPHSWALPRLSGRAKSALVEIQSDEYGRGVPGAAHAEIFAVTMESLGLDATYGHYIDLLPATTLATGNLIGLLGRQRRLLPALIGHLALFEMTSTGPMARYSATLEALGVAPEGRAFFDVHVEADAYHEVLALTDLVGGHLADVPDAGPEISFGALALMHVEGAFSAHLLDAFAAGTTSLRDRSPESVFHHQAA